MQQKKQAGIARGVQYKFLTGKQSFVHGAVFSFYQNRCRATRSDPQGNARIVVLLFLM
jgi:hypothetical protein